MNGFLKHTLLMFFALRAGDLVNVAAGMWFVPRYVSPQDIGAVLPVSSFATFLSLPMFAFAMTVMKESAQLAAAGERGKVKSLLTGVFVAVAAILVLVMAVSALVVPHFLEAMRVSDCSIGFLVVAAAFLGCTAPVYADALQSLKRFRALATVEIAGSVMRFLTMLAVMPFRALAGYFAGQAVIPAVRMAGSIVALRDDLAVRGEPYWNRAAAKRIGLSFLAVIAYQAAPMFASLVEQSILRTTLPAVDSAGYYMISRSSDFLYCLTFPLMLVMFPYTATAAQRKGSTRPFVLKCSATTLAAAVLMAGAYSVFGEHFLSLMPHGTDYADYAVYMPWLVAITALTTCQVFFTNAEVSAGRFGFLYWLVPLHIAYPAVLHIISKCGYVKDLHTMIAWIGIASVLRFVFASIGMFRPRNMV